MHLINGRVYKMCHSESLLRIASEIQTDQKVPSQRIAIPAKVYTYKQDLR